jgi:hypothetical protein
MRVELSRHSVGAAIYIASASLTTQPDGASGWNGSPKHQPWSSASAPVRRPGIVCWHASLRGQQRRRDTGGPRPRV